jgi:hypothetical protein
MLTIKPKDSNSIGEWMNTTYNALLTNTKAIDEQNWAHKLFSNAEPEAVSNGWTFWKKEKDGKFSYEEMQQFTGGNNFLTSGFPSVAITKYREIGLGIPNNPKHMSNVVMAYKVQAIMKGLAKAVSTDKAAWDSAKGTDEYVTFDELISWAKKQEGSTTGFVKKELETAIQSIKEGETKGMSDEDPYYKEMGPIE